MSKKLKKQSVEKSKEKLLYYKCANALSKIIKYKKKYHDLRMDKDVYSIVSKIIKNKEIYDQIILESNFKAKSHFLALVHIHEIVNKRFSINKSITANVQKIYDFLQRDAANSRKFIRINTLKVDQNFIKNFELEIYDYLLINPKIFQQFIQNNIKSEKAVVLHLEPKLPLAKNLVDEKKIIHQNNNEQKDFILNIANGFSVSSQETENKDLIEVNQTPSKHFPVRQEEIITSISEISTSISEISPDIKEYIATNILIPTQVENVIKVDININLTSLKSYISGSFVIQHFSSCLPAFVLNPSLESTVIDACAAPGNKTSHLSAIMNNTGRILAYEKDKERYTLLNQMLKKYGCSNTETFCVDFTDVAPTHSDYILVDPSCSCSGTHKEINQKDKKRIKKLAHFQFKLLNHALKFKNIKRIVYSTCSVYSEENESVVDTVLQENQDYCTERIEIKGLSSGVKGFKCSDHVIRTPYDPSNSSQGFFVALIVPKVQKKI